MKTILKFLTLLIGVPATALAQEPLLEISEGRETPQGFYKAGIRYGETKSDSLYIRWSRAAKADTFWVYKGHLSLKYITDANVRTVFYNQPMKYERRMATHHLREFIFDSPLKFSDIEALAKNQNPPFLKKNLGEFFSH